MALTLFAYPPSVYCQIVRVALMECGQNADLTEVDPFADPDDSPHPFGQVPVLNHDGFELYETTAILRYLDTEFADGRLTPPRTRRHRPVWCRYRRLPMRMDTGRWSVRSLPTASRALHLG